MVKTLNSSSEKSNDLKIHKYKMKALWFQYEKTVSAVYSACDDSIEIMLDLMRIHREKGVAIFTKLCTLLAIFCYDTQRAKVRNMEQNLLNYLMS